MSNVITLLRRELGQLFRSPLAYVFLVLFVVFVQLPFMLSVFLSRTADMRSFFGLLPWFVVCFAALVTMRSWAEERQENTYEMLLTFPMRDWELVVAKFLATYLFLCVGIAATFTLPLMLVTLGEPDVGPIITGYLGAYLVAAMWCAAGVFFSSLTRSQLLAAIVSFVLGLVSLFVGISQVAEVIDGKVSGLGSLLGSTIGTWGHFDALSRGVIGIADVLFFVAWTAVFLYLNTLYVGMRRAPRATTILTAGTLLAVGCGLLGARLLSDASIARVDLTEEGLYTLSQGTVDILKRADVPIRATFYVSPQDDMPAEMAMLERDIVDRLTEMRLQTGGMLDVRVVHMEAANLTVKPEEEITPELDGEDGADVPEADAGEEKSIERRLIAKGVEPFQVQSFDATEVTTKYVYATLELAYAAKDPELIHPLVPARLPELEYVIASTVARLVRNAPPRIALYTGEAPMDPQIRAYYKQQGQPIPSPYQQVGQLLQSEKYDVRPTKLTAHSPMPSDYDAFVVVGPVDWNDRARWELNRALAAGKPVLLAAQRFTWDFSNRGGRIVPSMTTSDIGVDDVLAPAGIRISDRLLMQEENAIPLRFNLGGLSQLMGGTPITMPNQIGLLAGDFNTDSAITDRIDSLFYLWGTALELDRDAMLKAGLDVTVLAQTGEQAWSVPTDRPLRNPDIAAAGQDFARYPLLALIEGQFDDVYAGGERPDYPVAIEMGPNGRPVPPPGDLPETPFTAAPGRLFVTGSASMWQDGILASRRNPGNMLLMLNCVSAMTLDPALLEVRSKQARPRQFKAPSDMEATIWTAVPLVIVPLVLIAIGLAVGVMRMRSREAWNAEHGR